MPDLTGSCWLCGRASDHFDERAHLPVCSEHADPEADRRYLDTLALTAERRDSDLCRQRILEAIGRRTMATTRGEP